MKENSRWELFVFVAIALGAGIGAAAMTALIQFTGTGPLMQVIGGRLPWYTTRAAGISAYLMLSATTLLGLTITAKGPNRPFSRATVFVLHEFLSWLAWGFVGLHIAALLVDTFQPFNPVDVLVPFASTYRTIPTGLGVIGLYLIGVLVTSFYARRELGQKVWRALHFSSFLLFVVATLHGFSAGSSSGEPWMQAIYAVSSVSVIALLVYRIARARSSRRPAGLTEPRRANNQGSSRATTGGAVTAS